MSAVASHAIPVIRPMTDADVPRVIEVEHAGYDFPWTTGIFRDCLRVGYCCWVAEDADGMLGHLVMSVAAGEAHILNVCVHPKAQRRGVGRHLMEYAVPAARRLGAAVLLLEVRPSNTPAIGLYRALGFEEIGRRRGYYPSEDGREDALVFAMAL